MAPQDEKLDRLRLETLQKTPPRDAVDKLPAASGIPDEIAASVQTGLTAQSLVEIAYENAEGEATRRKVLPTAFFLRYGVWYMEAYCTLRQSLRTFRFDRIASARATDEKVSPAVTQLLKKRRPIDTLSFFWETGSPPSPLSCDTGYVLKNGVWLKKGVLINGRRPEAPAICFEEFARMLRGPGEYWPFTCSCGQPLCANIDFPVRCLHQGEYIILVIRDPIIDAHPCESCQNEETCPYERWECPWKHCRYRAYRFLRSDVEKVLNFLP